VAWAFDFCILKSTLTVQKTNFDGEVNEKNSFIFGGIINIRLRT
jgi:hypothetical protein